MIVDAVGRMLFVNHAEGRRWLRSTIPWAQPMLIHTYQFFIDGTVEQLTAAND